MAKAGARPIGADLTTIGSFGADAAPRRQKLGQATARRSSFYRSRATPQTLNGFDPFAGLKADGAGHLFEATYLTDLLNGATVFELHKSGARVLTAHNWKSVRRSVLDRNDISQIRMSALAR